MPGHVDCVSSSASPVRATNTGGACEYCAAKRRLVPLSYPSQVTPALAHVAQPQREFRRKPKRAPTTFAASRLMARAFALSRVKPAGNTWVAMTHYIAKQAYYLARKPLLSRQMQTSESR